MSNESFNKANFLFIDKKYKEALILYSKALAENSSSEYFEKRAHCYLKLKLYKESLEDSSNAISKDKTYVMAYLRQGIAHYKLGQYQQSKNSFKEGLSYKTDHNSLRKWYRILVKLLGEKEEVIQEVTLPSPSPKVNLKPKPFVIRHNWYQLGDEIVLSVVLKKVNSGEATVKFDAKKVSLVVQRKDGRIHKKCFDLSNEIVPSESSFKIYNSNIELTMKKKEDMEWKKLLSQEKLVVVTKTPSPFDHHGKDWDAIGTKIDEDLKEDLVNQQNDGLHNLFKTLYAGGDDKVKRAMMKSYSESGGTVLSTNWKDVANRTVDPQLRKGEELKSFK